LYIDTPSCTVAACGCAAASDFIAAAAIKQLTPLPLIVDCE
jgi:hypothetical protein